MSLQRLNPGAVLMFAAIVAACSSGDSSKITAQTPAAAADRSSASNGQMDHDTQITWGPVRVLRGTFLVGLGENFSKSALQPLKVDGFITAPANMAHFASARGITEVQVHAIGPFQLTYVHPEDDPRK